MKENQRVTITKRMLWEGFLRLMQEKKPQEIRINELCAEAGINRATFYRHYKTIHDVLVDLERDFIKQATPAAKHPRNIADVRKMLESTCTYIYEHADTARLLFLYSTEEDMTRRTNELYQYFVELHKNEEQFADMDRESLRIILAFMSGGGYNLLRQWLLENIPKTPQEITELLFSMVYSITQWSCNGSNAASAGSHPKGR